MMSLYSAIKEARRQGFQFIRRRNGVVKYDITVPLMTVMIDSLLSLDWEVVYPVITKSKRIKMTEHDVGKLVRTRNGHVFQIIGFGKRHRNDLNCVLIGTRWYPEDGHLHGVKDSEYDIVAFADDAVRRDGGAVGAEIHHHNE